MGFVAGASSDHGALSSRGVYVHSTIAPVVHSAALYGHELLLEYALLVEPFGVLSADATPLHLAAIAGWPKLIPMLIEHGFDPLLPGPEGWSAFEVACLQRSVPVTSFDRLVRIALASAPIGSQYY